MATMRPDLVAIQLGPAGLNRQPKPGWPPARVAPGALRVIGSTP
jgi:hypothetical protein